MHGKGGHCLEKEKGVIAGSDQPPSSSDEEAKQMFSDMIRLLNDKQPLLESVGA